MSSTNSPPSLCALLRDVLYIPEDKWDGFVSDPFDRRFEPDLLDQILSHHGARVGCIAMPEALLRSEVVPVLAEMLVSVIFFWPSLLLIARSLHPT